MLWGSPCRKLWRLTRPLRQLRTLLAAQEQWKSAEQREALAARAAASGEAELALALRRRDTSLLRKRHLLFLAHTWGLRSDLWRRKQRAGPAARQEGERSPAPPPPPQSPLLLLPPPASPGREAALTHALHVRSLATAHIPSLRVHAAALTSGAEARRAIAATDAFALVTPFALDEWRGVLTVNQHLMAASTATLAALAALRADPAFDGDAPAWTVMNGETTPVETLLSRVRDGYAIGVRLIQTRSAARWRDREPNAVERVYFEEPLASAHDCLELLARASASLTQLRLSRAAPFLTAAEAVTQELSVTMRMQDEAARARLGWLSDFVTRRDTEAARSATAKVVPANFPAL